MGLGEWLRRLFGAQPSPPSAGSPPSRSAGAGVPAPTPPAQRQASPVARAPTPQEPSGEPALQRLELSRFAPLAGKELEREAQRVNLRTDPWLGRTDTIPPADDLRTALIDRALVGEGLLTPEQLARIHQVGDQYREFRVELGVAAQEARQAVVDDQEERKRRKAQKQAEAKARREAHVLAVRERRANDIVFLGRGVSNGLADRRADVARLERLGLPPLATPADVAAFFQVPIPRLRWLAWHSEASQLSHYVFFTIPKKTGGVRRLSAPHRDLARCQRLIFQRILPALPADDAAHGFVRGRGTLTNARPHVGAAIVVNLDLKDFFPSIRYPRVRGLLTSLGFSPASATILALLCTECPREEVGMSGKRWFVASGTRALPQGACTSPGLANLIARILDARLRGLAAAWGWTYTRYADDLTFSSVAANADVGRLLTAVRNIVVDEGFTVHEDKTRVQRRSQAMEVTGLVVNERPKIPRALARRLRAILHRAKHEGLAAQNREGHPHFAGWLAGMIAYVAMTDRTLAAKFALQFEQVGGRAAVLADAPAPRIATAAPKPTVGPAAAGGGRDLADGESIEMQGSGAKPYVLRNVGGVYSCSCPAWRNQSAPIEQRTCKHLRKLRGEAAEAARTGQGPKPDAPQKPPEA